ncbi:MAG: glycosyl transferase family 2, partial [Sphaerospermopsis sp. SIO1G2]|nr:glycosyl transferase family 2 [Sphaerospermopsis sp. SIO1G2]
LIILINNQRIDSATQENSIKWGKDKLNGIIPDLIRETFINQSLQVGSTLFRRDCLLEVDFMRPEADGCEDFDLLVRLAITDKKGYFLPEYLMEYRFHGGQTSLRQNLHFLKAKVFCIDSYKFPDPELEKLRSHKLATTQQVLGLRLIENGDTVEGRKVLQASSQVIGNDKKIILGLIMSYLPMGLRKLALDIFRQLRPQDYTEKVREAKV